MLAGIGRYVVHLLIFDCS